VDRQDYLVNWLVREDKRNIQLSAIAAVDNDHGYCFGLHLNFDSSLDSEAIQAEVERNGDLAKPYPHRRFSRLWLNADHEEASAKSVAKKRRKGGLPTEIDDTYAAALIREDIESPDAPSPVEQLPEYGMQTHGEYTMYGHFFFLKRLLGLLGLAAGIGRHRRGLRLDAERSDYLLIRRGYRKNKHTFSSNASLLAVR
jgi:hypothetical protein